MSLEQNTSFDTVYKRFFDRVEKDPDFFKYYNISEDKAMEIAVLRAESLLKDAIDVLMTKCSPDVNFHNYDDELECFNFKITSIEIKLLCDIMYELYLKKDIVNLKPILNVLTASDIKALYSPNSERKTFQDLCKFLEAENEKSISKYIAKDRLTNKWKSIYDRR
jgi:hypothetical protein